MNIRLDFSYKIITEEQARLKNGKVYTNYFLSEEKFMLLENRKQKVLWRSENGFYFMVEQDGFYKLFFISNHLIDLKNNIDQVIKKYNNHTVVVEVVGNRGYLNNILSEITKAGFHNYSRLVRMTKIKSDLNQLVQFENIHQLKHDKLEEIRNLFNIHFDKFSDQIPTEIELKKIADWSDIYYYSDETIIQGFVIFQKIGITSHLNYLFVQPNHRRKQIGSKLLKVFLSKYNEVKRQILWVVDINDRAIKMYKHFGFVEEDMFNIVLTNKIFKHENQNYHNIEQFKA
jgi:ribosomal protein S18 acetylase RimI-like enzyme